MRNQEWDPALAQLNALDLAELVLGLLGLNAVHGEAALGVVDETEVLASLLNGDHVHEAGGVGRVSADLAVDLDVALHEDGLRLTRVQGILEAVHQNGVSTRLASEIEVFLCIPVADEHDQGQAVTGLVRTRRGLRRIGSGHFVQEPVPRSAQALLVLDSVRIQQC